MLTASQCATVAYYLPDAGELYCERCFESSGEAMAAVSQYEASEHQSALADGAYEDADADEHVQDCACEPALECGGCYGEILDEYVDTRCEDLAEREWAMSARCAECRRVFDLTDADVASEWYYGHDCEAAR
jgi:hypothetical protein